MPVRRASTHLAEDHHGALVHIVAKQVIEYDAICVIVDANKLFHRFKVDLCRTGVVSSIVGLREKNCHAERRDDDDDDDDDDDGSVLTSIARSNRARSQQARITMFQQY
jgi:hypothetical protein